MTAKITPIGAGGGWYSVHDDSRRVAHRGSIARGIVAARTLAAEIDALPTLPALSVHGFYDQFIQTTTTEVKQ